MNKQKYLDKIYKKRTYHSSVFKKIIMVCQDGQFKIVLNKVFNTKLIDDYVAPLIEYYDEGYLIKPVNKMNFKNFVSDIDVLVINTSMHITFIKESASHLILNFELDSNSIIILPKGFVRMTQLKIGDKIKFKTIIHI